MSLTHGLASVYQKTTNCCECHTNQTPTAHSIHNSELIINIVGANLRLLDIVCHALMISQQECSVR